MGTIGRTIAESTATPTSLPKPPPGAPNVVVIVLDDVGFAQLEPFGSDIATPAISALADGGVRFRNFHVTAMCSPTRAAMLTGQNHHAVGMGFLPEVPIGFPGYNARIPKSAAAMPRLLRDAGYSTFAVGKWHLTPRWEVSASGPFTQWPLGMGFERYYGFLSGDTNQFAPELVCDNGVIPGPDISGGDYHLSADLADRAIRFIQDAHQATPGKPFLLWLATGAQHAPHQAPRAWIDRFAGHFDQGWDAWRTAVFERQLQMGLVPEGTTPSERPSWVQPWSSLGRDEQRLYARMMEVYAGFLAYTDAQIQRVLDYLKRIGQFDNTLIMLASDNGASAEGGPHGSFNEHRFTHDLLDDPADTLARIDDLGGPRSYNHYAWGWAWAGNTPFKLWKRYTWLGGTRTPLIVHWPDKISDPGSVRPQFCHAVDLLPTVLAATGVTRPAEVDGVAQRALDGASLLDAVESASAPEIRSTQYFELLGSRSIVHDGWKATTDHVGAQISIEAELLEGSRDFADDHWSLFRLADDFAEVHDRSDEYPDVAARLEAAWWTEAERNQVLPLDDTFIGRSIAMDGNPWPVGLAATYLPGGGPVAEDMLPPMGPGFTMLASVHVDAGELAMGVIAALGDWNNGWVVRLDNGIPRANFVLFGDDAEVAGAVPLEPGDHEIALEYRRDAKGGGPMRLFIDGIAVGDGILKRDLPFRWQIGGAGLRIGHDEGFPVVDRYQIPATATFKITQLTIESHALNPPGPETDLHRIMHHE